MTFSQTAVEPDGVHATVQNAQFETLRQAVERRLERIHHTVDEKLHATPERRLSESFRQVSERLELVHKGLGEMQTLASGVGDLKRVLSNVKTPRTSTPCLAPHRRQVPAGSPGAGRKYLEPPATTEFALLYLPFEGLYAEVLRRPGLFEQLQREWRVTICGPTTLTAVLNSLQMGFRTLAIEKRSSEVWKVLVKDVEATPLLDSAEPDSPEDRPAA